jgi:CDP-6-deoxy-D-xylo-4-hexulose-3-dehydrase
MTSIRVPYGLSVHSQAEIDAVVHAMRQSTQMGHHVRTFEHKVAALFNKKHGVMVNSGSSALLLAVEVLNLPKGSEVITPVLTFSTTVAALVKNGLVPAFVDIAPQTYCIDVAQIESMITDKTSAICVPNLIGNVPDWPAIAALAKKYNLKVIEDSADTLGATIGDVPTGQYSDISITSFYGSHVINAAGNGGMLCLNDDTMKQEALLLRSWGRRSSVYDDSEAIENRFNVNLDGIEYDAKFVFDRIGYNFEPSEVGAAFGLEQLKKLQSNIQARISNFYQQWDFFDQYSDCFELPVQRPDVKTGWLAFPVRIRGEAPFMRRQFQIFLERQNIQTRVVFTGNILRQPGFKDIVCKKAPGGYPHADAVMRSGVLLACHQGLTAEMLAHVHQTVQAFVNDHVLAGVSS